MPGKKFCLVGVDNDFIDLIQENRRSFIGYFSENKRFYKSINKKNWLGDHTLENWNIIKKKYNPNVLIAVDDNTKREELYKTIYKKNCKNFIFKKSYLAKSSKLKLSKKNCIIIQNYSKIMPNVEINNGVKIHIGAQIHHDCIIGEFSTIAPKALLLGNVEVGKNVYIGANSTIKQKVKIGKGAIIGAGSVVIRDVKDFDMVAGIPAKSIKTN